MKKHLTILLTIILFQNQAFCQFGFVGFPVLNAAHNTATNTEKFVETLAHEYAHNYTSKEGIANSAGSFAKFMWGIGNVLNFTGINTSGNATSRSWYNANYGSNLLQSNTQMAKSISYDDREHSTLAYRGTKTILNAAGIETSNRKSFEDNIASRVFGLTLGTTDKAEERQENLLYGMQNAGSEYGKLPSDLVEVGKDIAGVPGKAAEGVKATYNAKGEALKAAADTGIVQYYFDATVYASANPQETASKLANTTASVIDGMLFKGIRSGFNNDNLVYAIGQVWSGTISDIGLLYGGASLLGSSAGKATTITGMRTTESGAIEFVTTKPPSFSLDQSCSVLSHKRNTLGIVDKISNVNSNGLIINPKFAPQTSGFYISRQGELVPVNAYRYISKDSLFLDSINKTRTIPFNQEGIYITFNKYNVPAGSMLQTPHDASIRIQFNTYQILDDIRIPRGLQGKAEWHEAITVDYPEFGNGNATQRITNGPINKINDIKDLNKK